MSLFNQVGPASWKGQVTTDSTAVTPLTTKEKIDQIVSLNGKTQLAEKPYRADPSFPILPPPRDVDSPEKFYNSHRGLTFLKETPLSQEEQASLKQADHQATYRSTFESTLSQEKLSNATKAQLRFYHYHPEMKAPLEIGRALQVVEKKTLTSFQASSNALPKDWKPVIDNSEVDVPVSVAYENAFLAEAEKTTLSKGQLKTLRYILANPNEGVNFPDLNRLKSEIDQKVIAQIRNEYGVPDGVPLKASWKINGEIKGSLNYEVDKHLANFMDKKNLSMDEATLLKNALKNGTVEGLSAKQIKLFNEFKTSIPSINHEVIHQNGLPGTWQADFSQIKSTFPLNDPQFSSLRNADGMLTQAKSAISLLPNNAAKVDILNFLKKLTDALTELKTILFQSLEADSAAAKRMGDANLSLEKEKAELQLKNLEENKVEMQKQKDLQLAMKILGPILILISLIISALTGGALGFIIAAAMAAITLVEQQFGGINKMFEAISTAIQNDPNIPPEHKEAVKIIVKVLLVATIVAAAVLTGSGISAAGSALAGLQATITGLQLGVSSLLGSQVIVDILKAAGVSEDARQIVSMVIGMVLMIVISIVGMRAMKAVQDLPEQVSAAAQKFKDIIKNISDKIPQIRDAFKAVFASMAQYQSRLGPMFSLIQTTLQMSTSIVNAISNFSKAEAALSKAEIEAAIEEIEALIKQLKKTINKFMQQATSAAEDLEKEGQFSRSIWDGLRNSLPNYGGSA